MGDDLDRVLRRGVISSAYNVVANIFRVAVLFGRSVALARLLEPRVFGVYAFASSIVTLTRPLPALGLGGALLYRTPAGWEEEARRTHFDDADPFGYHGGHQRLAA